MNAPHLIGHAGALAASLAQSLPRQDRHKLLFTGQPGIGKTALANYLALELTGSKFGVESINGRHVTKATVRDWAECFGTSSLWGTGWKVVVVNEVDLCQKDAQDALLSFLDEMPASRAFIGTSNLDLANLTERFRTRFSRYEVKPPSAPEIYLLLTEQGLPDAVAAQFAELCSGNVRAALLDADAWKNENTPDAPRAVRVKQTQFAA